jgi:deoxyribonuclease-4
VDRHEEIGRGRMGLEPFRWLMNDARFQDTVGVLETPAPERYAQSIALLQGLAH